MVDGSLMSGSGRAGGLPRTQGRETNRVEGGSGGRLGRAVARWWPATGSVGRWHGWATDEITAVWWGRPKDGAVAGGKEAGEATQGVGRERESE